MNKRPLNIAVIGVGRLGSLHARTYTEIPNINLVGVCDIKRQRAQQAASECATEKFLDYRKLLGRQPDAVSIAVPTSLHYEIAREALMQGIHVLVEKPITKTLKEADALLKIARNRNLILQVGHVERFNAAVEAIQKLPARPLFIECHRLGPYYPRVADVGVVLDLMIHDLDIILGMVKSKIKKIQATGVKILTPHEDIANARITFTGGTVCNVTASRVTEKSMRKIRIFQQNAYISLDYVNQSALIYRKQKGKIRKRLIDIQKQQPLKKELFSFTECLRKKRRPLVSGREGRQALKAALTIIRLIHNRQ